MAEAAAVRPWGPRQVAAGIGLGVAALVATQVVLAIAIGLAGVDFLIEDVAGPFNKAEEVLKYADERFEALGSGTATPDPARITADITALRLAFLVTLGYQLLLFSAAVTASRKGLRGFVRGVRLDRPPRFWPPVLVMIAAYFFVGAYSYLAEAINIDLLEPQSTVPGAVSRDGVALVLTGLTACLVAPVAEESFFRGLFTTGLLGWGKWAALGLSSLAFTAAHADPGSLLPFFLVGCAMGWLYLRRRCLWDSIACHMLFNGTSFLLLLAGTG